MIPPSVLLRTRGSCLLRVIVGCPSSIARVIPTQDALGPGLVCQLIRMSSLTPKGCGLDPILGVYVRQLIDVLSLSLSLSLSHTHFLSLSHSLPPSLKSINKSSSED